MKNGINSTKDTKTTQPLIVGNGIWDWIMPLTPEERAFKVEDLYKAFDENMWDLLDEMLADRPDLQERIEKYKRSTRAMKTEL